MQRQCVRDYIDSFPEIRYTFLESFAIRQISQVVVCRRSKHLAFQTASRGDVLKASNSGDGINCSRASRTELLV